MALKINEFMTSDGEVVKKAANKRVVKALLVGARVLDNEKKKTKSMILVFADSVGVNEKTGQPIITSFNPIIECYVPEPSDDVLALENVEVFTPYYIKISGNEDFTMFHGILTDEQVAAYKSIIGDLI